MTEMYQPILRIVNELHRSDPEDEYMPISDFVCQNLTSVFYAVFDGDFAALRDSLLDPEMDDEIRDHLAFMLLQLILDGILSEEKRDQMLDQYLQFVFDQGAVGDAAAHWIVRTGQVNQRKKQLRKLLTYHVNPMYYGMTDPTRFEMMVMERSFSDCRKGIVMDDMILHGMYPKVIHPPKEIRNRAVSEQDRRIREMIQQQNQQAGG